MHVCVWCVSQVHVSASLQYMHSFVAEAHDLLLHFHADAANTVSPSYLVCELYTNMYARRCAYLCLCVCIACVCVLSCL
jgi:hypothetical protein